MDDWAALRLQVEWGADEALLDAPVDRLARGPAAAVAAADVPAQGRAGLAREDPGAGNATAKVGAPRPAPRQAAALQPALAEATDVAAVHAALDALAHPLRATATHTVRPSGNPAAGLVLVAEAPGRDDDRSGEAFGGAPGQALDAVLASAGLGRDRLLLTFLVPWRPPGGREPNAAEVAGCVDHLHRLIALAGARRLVLLGQGPLRVLTAATSLRQARGRWLEALTGGLVLPALAMLPPDQWRKTPANRQNTWADLMTLRAALDAE